MRMEPYRSLSDALLDIRKDAVTIKHTAPVSGGDINRAVKLTLSDGTALFMKTNKKENLPFFTAEAEGIFAIAETASIGTPKLLAVGTDDLHGGCAFLLQEVVSPGRKIPDYYEVFGRALAAMHCAPCGKFVPGGVYGFVNDNFIGASKQSNTPADSWIAFFRDERLLPQLRRADAYLDSETRKQADRLLTRLPDYLTEPAHPSLLHGDLWGGNHMTGPFGEAILIDPAAYVGHAEADLAMTELFGALPERFYAAYSEVSPIAKDYPARRDLYNLYHLLNHLNLFGVSYLGSVRSILARYA